MKCSSWQADGNVQLSQHGDRSSREEKKKKEPKKRHCQTSLSEINGVLFVYISSLKQGHITLVFSHGTSQSCKTAACQVGSVPQGSGVPHQLLLVAGLFLHSVMNHLKFRNMCSLFLIWVISIFVGWKLILVFWRPLHVLMHNRSLVLVSSSSRKTCVIFLFQYVCQGCAPINHCDRGGQSF